MDGIKTESRREIDLLKRQMKDREAGHARELDNLQHAHKERIDSLTENQQQTLERVRKENNESLEATRDRFDEQVAKNSDHFQKTMDAERVEAYDRYGRLATESARSRATQQERSAAQMRDLIENNESRLVAQKDLADRKFTQIRDTYSDDRRKIQEAYDKKLDSKNEAMQEAIRAQQHAATAQLNEVDRKSDQYYSRQKLAADSRIHKLVEDGAHEREQLVASFKSREKQLLDDDSYNKKLIAGNADKTLDDFRQRSSEALRRTIDDNNVRVSEAQRAADAEMKRADLRNKNEKQDLRNSFRSAEADLIAKNEIERDRAELQSSLAEKRHRQEMDLHSLATSDTSALNNEEMREKYQEGLRNLSDTSRRQLERIQTDSQRRLYDAEMTGTADRARLEGEKAQERARIAIERARERKNLVNSYESRQSASDERHERQLIDQRAKSNDDMKYVRDKAAKDVRMTNLENTTRLYEARRDLRDLTTEMEYLRNQELEQVDQKNHDRIRRLSDMYNRQTVATQDAVEEASAESKYENLLQMAKQRGDAEHEKRMALMELVMKNRAIATQYEQKMNTMKDEKDSALAKLKTENDKAMRETVRRVKEQMDSERTLFQRELAAKDLQIKEKLKLQEEAFKEQIERLKRSHELQLKKS